MDFKTCFLVFFFINTLTKKATWLGFSEWEPDVFGGLGSAKKWILGIFGGFSQLGLV